MGGSFPLYMRRAREHAAHDASREYGAGRACACQLAPSSDRDLGAPQELECRSDVQLRRSSGDLRLFVLAQHLSSRFREAGPVSTPCDCTGLHVQADDGYDDDRDDVALTRPRPGRISLATSLLIVLSIDRS